MTTLVIHPEDETTDCLKHVYANITNKVVIRSFVEEQELIRMIDESQRVIMLGHGSPHGLICLVGGFKFIVHEGRIADALRRKEGGNVYIWCFADQFVHKHNLKGIYTGMFISEVGEAALFDIECGQAEVDHGNDVFSRLLGEMLATHALEDGAAEPPLRSLDEAYEHVKEHYGKLVDSSPVAAYNHVRWQNSANRVQNDSEDVGEGDVVGKVHQPAECVELSCHPHTLLKTTGPRARPGAIQCDVCGTFPSTSSHFCDMCNWDICDGCFEAWSARREPGSTSSTDKMTLVIHPEDESTSFLKQIYARITNKIVVTRYVNEDELIRLIDRSQRVIMLGHGSPEGLLCIDNGFKLIVREGRIARALRNKEGNNVFIWCHADQFVHKHGLQGIYSGMFISEVGEAMMYEYEVEQTEVDASNNLFARLLGEMLATHPVEDGAAEPPLRSLDEAYEHVKEHYGRFAESSQIGMFNHERWQNSKSRMRCVSGDRAGEDDGEEEPVLLSCHAHALLPSTDQRTVPGTTQCDICSSSYNRSSHFCDQCNWDICVDCFDAESAQDEATAIANADVAAAASTEPDSLSSAISK